MALGMIEVYGFTTSIVVADCVAKTADVKIVAIDKNKPAGGDSAEVPLVMVISKRLVTATVPRALSIWKLSSNRIVRCLPGENCRRIKRMPISRHLWKPMYWLKKVREPSSAERITVTKTQPFINVMERRA